MMRYIKRFAILLMLLFVFQTAPVWSLKTAPADELTKKQQELNKVYKNLVERKRALQETKRKEAVVVQKLFVINKELKKTKGQLGRATQQIEQNEKRLNYLQSSLKEAKQKMDSKSSLFRDRTREIYKSKGTNYLEMLISPNTLSDFINKTYFFEKLLSYDSSLINNMIAQHKKIKTNKIELEGVTSDIKVLAKYIEVKRNNIQKQSEEKKEVYKELEGRAAKYEQEIAVLEETSKQMEQLIKTLVSEHASKGIVAHGSGSFIWPVRGRLTSQFGYRRSLLGSRNHMHTGLDIANSYGTPIKAADSGEVLFAGWWDGYGKAVIIDHGKGISTVYAHMSRIYVQKGQAASQGQVIGLLGSTGYSTGPHLHFEVRKNGSPQNPTRWLP